MKNVLSVKEYQELVKRTCPDLGSIELNLSHMVLGMFSEYSEYLLAVAKNDKVNIGEELCDSLWYMANYCTFRGYDFQLVWEDREQTVHLYEDPEKEYIYWLAELQDLIKKNIAYGKPIHNKEVDVLNNFLFNLDLIIKSNKLHLGTILFNNIAKLQVRFPDKFDKEKALNRNLDAERVELEK